MAMPVGSWRRSDRPRGALRFWVGFSLKLCVTVGLLFWLSETETLTAHDARRVLARTDVACVAVVAWAVAQLWFATQRWRTLLVPLGYELGFAEAAGLQATAAFFNAVLPGNVGGDLFKNRDALAERPASVVGLILVERVTGLWGMILCLGLGLFWAATTSNDSRATTELLLFSSGLFAAALVLPGLLFGSLALRDNAETAAYQTAKDAPVWRKLLRPLTLSLRSAETILRFPRAVLTALLYSVLLQLSYVACFTYMAWQFGNPDASVLQLALIYPIGMLSIALPITFSGMGVGHVAFQALFSAVGLVRGADVFNVFILSMILSNSLGALPFIFLRRRQLRMSAPHTAAS